jgi:hypothetical protein
MQAAQIADYTEADQSPDVSIVGKEKLMSERASA